METPEQAPEELSAKQAAEELDEDSEAVPTPTDIDEELEDRGDK
jgi:hypothetical protein